MLFSNVQTGAQVYLIKGLEEPPNEREVNMKLVTRLPQSPFTFPLKLQSCF